MSGNKKVGFVCGVFDLFHIGHVWMLKQCRAQCDYLLVAVNECTNVDYTINPDKNPPIFSAQNRKEMLENSIYVDEVITYNSEDDLLDILTNRNIAIRFLGDDYIGRKITGSKLNIKIHYIDRSHGFSSSKLRETILQDKLE